jgi:citrate lyase gamma subunit
VVLERLPREGLGNKKAREAEASEALIAVDGVDQKDFILEADSGTTSIFGKAVNTCIIGLN